MSAAPPPGGQYRPVRPRAAAPHPTAAPRAPAPGRAPVTPSRPLWFDFVLILAGFWLSLLLTDMSGFQAERTADTPTWIGTLLLRSLPYALLFPVGLLLLWPLFYLTQRLGGRDQPLSAGEWLWGVAWLGAVTFTIWIVWQAYGTPPDFLKPDTFKGQAFVGYAVGVLALGAVALLIGLIDLFGRWGQPWTHHFCLALTMWPALPLGALLLWRIEVK
ncbi:MAG: hypothetical protein L0Z62_46585 [Gemmataceae bacterium]|nr:hypothetical protein [Gemmataceae bacterium]